MNDSNVRERLDAKHERDRERRIEGIKRWVEYIRSEPADKWGPQQNAVVDDQLDAAQNVRMSAPHHHHVTDVASAVLAVSDTCEDDPD